MKRGFAQIVPLVIVLLLLIGGFAALSAHQQSSQKAAVGKVLSDRDSSGGGDDHGGSSGGSGGSTSLGSTSANSSGENKSSENRSSNKTEIKPEKPNKVEIKTPELETETHQENEGSSSSKIEEKIRVGGFKIEIKTENGKIVTKVKNEGGEEVEVENDVKDQLARQTDDLLEKEDIKIATGSAELGFAEHGNKVRTNFPLSVDPVTGQLFVTTPHGTKVVAILPAVAIKNMIAAGILTHVDTTPTPNPTPPSGTGSATPAASVLGTSTELTEDSGKLVYKIKGVKNENFLGILPVGLNLTAVVSAENGQLVSTQEGFFTRLLDFLSF